MVADILITEDAIPKAFLKWRLKMAHFRCLVAIKSNGTSISRCVDRTDIVKRPADNKAMDKMPAPSTQAEDS
jgi:hypothetical protein